MDTAVSKSGARSNLTAPREKNAVRLESTAHITAVYESIVQSFRDNLKPTEFESLRGVCLGDLKLDLNRLQQKHQNGKYLMDATRLQPCWDALEILEKRLHATISLPTPDTFGFLWGAMGYILRTAANFGDSIGALCEAYEEIGEMISSFHRSSSSAHQSHFIQTICLEILAFHRDVLPFFTFFSGQSWKIMFKANWGHFSTKFAGYLRSLNYHSKLFELRPVAFLDYWGGYQRIKYDVERRIAQEQSEKTASIQTWLSPRPRSAYYPPLLPDPEISVSDIYSRLITRPLHQHFSEWLSPDCLETQFLWIEMNIAPAYLPGITKICRELHVTSTIHVNCQQADTAIDVVNDLLFQITVLWPDCLPYIYERYTESSQVDLESVGITLDLFAILASIGRKLYIVLQNLDAIQLEEREGLLNKMLVLCSETTAGATRVLVVSQDYDGNIRRMVTTKSTTVKARIIAVNLLQTEKEVGIETNAGPAVTMGTSVDYLSHSPLPELVAMRKECDTGLESATTAVYTDSGYASTAPRPEDQGVGQEEQESRKPNRFDTSHDLIPMNVGTTHGPIYADISSIYSSDSVVLPSTKAGYIAQVAEVLMQNIPLGQLYQTSSLDHLCATLPGLLKSFASSLGHLKADHDSRTVMVFISKNREAIVAKVKADCEGEIARLREPAPLANDKVWSWMEEEVDRWVESNDQKAEGTPLIFPMDAETNLEPVDINSNEESNSSDSFREDGGHPISLDAEDETDASNLEEEEEWKMPIYRDCVTESSAFRWLISRITRDLDLTMSSAHVMRSISDKISRSLGSSTSARTLSKARGPHLFDVTFLTRWDPAAFVRDQRYDPAEQGLLGKVITLTGTMTDAQALTVEQYTQQTWPITGVVLNKAIEDAMIQDVKEGSFRRQYKLLNGTNISAEVIAGSVKVYAVGTVDAIVELGEQLAWMGAAVRAAPDDLGLYYCSPSIYHMKVYPPAAGYTRVTCGIDFALTRYETGSSSLGKTGKCWQALFCNPVIVEGYPIQSKPQSSMGLEIPLNIAATLGRAHRIQQFGINLFVKGFSSMLILTNFVTNIAVWHFLFNENGDHMSYTDPQTLNIQDPNIPVVGTYQLQSARHVVGWCSMASSFTGSPLANYNINMSHSRSTHTGCALEKVHISAGQFITAGASFVVGKKDDSIVVRARDDYLSQLRWISKKFVILYDVGDRRAWLTDGISALLHLVRASLTHDQNDTLFSDQSLFDKKDLVEAISGRSGKAAAIDVLKDLHNKELKLHRRSDESYDEETRNEEGELVTVTKRKITYYRFKDRVERIYNILEQMITHQSHVHTQDGVGFRVKMSARRQLEGFEFMDVASDEDPLRPRVVTLTSSGAGWVDFARHLHAITLFGRGFGELYKTSMSICQPWTEVPKGLDYLTACTEDLKGILKIQGDTKKNPWLLVDKIHWHNPDTIFGPCKSRGKNKTKKCCDRVQVLLPTSIPSLWARDYKSPSPLEDGGAVIFGHNRMLPLRWGDSGNPEQDDAPDSNEHLAVPSVATDSGLGSSISSSSSNADTSQPQDSSPDSTVTSKGKRKVWPFKSIRLGKQKEDADDSVEAETEEPSDSLLPIE